MSAIHEAELRDQLLTSGVLTPAQVEQAERAALERGVELETVLREDRLLREPQIMSLRAMRLGVPYCHLPDFIPCLQNGELLPEEMVRRHVMFPLFALDDVITLVMADPGDMAAIDQARRHTRREIEPCLSSSGDIVGLIERVYGASTYLQQSSVADSFGDADIEMDADESRPVIRLVDELLREAIRQGASDIHVEPGDRDLRIRLRVDGVLRETPAPPLGLHRAIVSRVKVISRLDISQTRAPQDGAFHYRDGDREVVVRVSILPSVYGEAMVLRLLKNESESISLTELGMGSELLEQFHRLVVRPYGMILVSGPTGSGKSTTLYAAMKTIASPQKNIIAIEDPVEYRTPAIRQIQVNPEAKLSFASGLRSILRQDPDVILVGEIRDAETAQIAVQASLTGHLVLSTVHTNDSVSAVARLRDLGVPEYLISSSLLAVLAQRLARRICPDCRQPDSPSPFLLESLGFDPANPGFQPMRGRGCRRCVGSGYLGRIGVFEMFTVGERYAELIAKGASTEVLRDAARGDGTPSLLDDAVDKIRQGVLSIEEVCRVIGRRIA